MDLTKKQLDDMLKDLKSRSKLEVILELGIFALVLSLLLIGNTFTLLIIGLNKRMRTIPNMFVASLAVSDFCVGAFTACPLGIPTLATSQWPFSDAVCQYQGYMAVSLAVASIQTLALMALNRYFRVVNRIKYRRLFTKRKTVFMMLGSWFYSMGAPLLYLLSEHKMIFHPSKMICFLHIDSGAFTVLLVTLYIGLPTFVIFGCYLKILKTVRRHNNNFQTLGAGNRTVNVEEVKITWTLFVIVVFFSLCWTPVLLIDIVDTVSGNWIFPREAYVSYIFLATLSNALNPFIYGVMNRNFRREYRKVLFCREWRSTKVKPLKVKGGANVVAMMEDDNQLKRRK